MKNMEILHAPGWDGFCVAGNYRRDLVKSLEAAIDKRFVYFLLNKDKKPCYVGQSDERENDSVTRFDEHRRKGRLDDRTIIFLFFNKKLFKNKNIRKFVEAKIFFYTNRILDMTNNKSAALVNNDDFVCKYLYLKSELDSYCKGVERIVLENFFDNNGVFNYEKLKNSRQLQLKLHANHYPGFYANAEIRKNIVVVKEGSYALPWDSENIAQGALYNNEVAIRTRLENEKSLVLCKKKEEKNLYIFKEDVEFVNFHEATNVILGRHRTNYLDLWTMICNGWPLQYFDVQFSHAKSVGKKLDQKKKPLWQL